MPVRPPINQLARYHRETLLDQIADLHEQIETNLENKQSIRHLKDLIAERQQYLSQIDAGTTQSGAKRGPRVGANRPGGYTG